VVPADHKWFARVVIGSAIVSALEGLKFPRVDQASLQEFKAVRSALEHEGEGGRKRRAGREDGDEGRLDRRCTIASAQENGLISF
jgi:hypothetical protein